MQNVQMSNAIAAAENKYMVSIYQVMCFEMKNHSAAGIKLRFLYSNGFVVKSNDSEEPLENVNKIFGFVDSLCAASINRCRLCTKKKRNALSESVCASVV